MKKALEAEKQRLEQKLKSDQEALEQKMAEEAEKQKQKEEELQVYFYKEGNLIHVSN